MAFKHYEVSGYPRPLRLSQEHAEALGGVEVGAPDPNRPAPSAKKAEWVEYAETKGMLPEEAEAHTKAELVEQFGE